MHSRSVAVIILMLFAGMSLGAPTSSHAQAAPDFTNGLTPADRAIFYHLGEGGEIYPTAWLKVLKNPKTGKLFLETPERYSLLLDKNSPEKLPIGITAGEIFNPLDPSKPSLGRQSGFNCAACHVGELADPSGQKRMRIDGMPNLFNVKMYLEELIGSSLAMIKDPEEFLAFMNRLAAQEAAAAGPQEACPILLHFDTWDSTDFLARSRLTSWILPAKKEMQAHANTFFQKFQNLPKMKETAGPQKAFYDFLVRMLTVEGAATLANPETSPEEFPLGKDVRNTFQRLCEVGNIDDKRIDDLLNQWTNPTALISHVADAGKALEAQRLIIPRYIRSFRLLIHRTQFLRGVGDQLEKRKAKSKDREVKPTESGNGRTDAFGNGRNTVFGEPFIQLTAPVSFPAVWGIKDIQWFHYDGNTTSVMDRNVAQAIGGFAMYDESSLTSNVKLDNLKTMETLAGKITPPKWPEELLGPIDQIPAARGRTVFQQHCAACHAPGTFGEKIPDRKYAVKNAPCVETSQQICTDPSRATNFAEPLKGNQKDKFQKAFQAARISSQDDSFAEGSGTFAKGIILKQTGHHDPVEWRTTEAYVTRPLFGVWATAPYLHNGSVPTLDDLLKPAKDRPKKFCVGHREYDPQKIGYQVITKCKKPWHFLFETRQTGNSNQGHEYGTKLPVSDRKALLEYLKVR